MKRRWYAFLFLAALVGLSGQRADAMRTPLTDVRAAITQPHQLTAATAASDLPADAWIVESIIPLGTTADGQPLALISFLVPLSSLDELPPTSTRAGPYAAPETHTRVFCIVQPPLGLATAGGGSAVVRYGAGSGAPSQSLSAVIARGNAIQYRQDLANYHALLGSAGIRAVQGQYAFEHSIMRLWSPQQQEALSKSARLIEMYDAPVLLSSNPREQALARERMDVAFIQAASTFMQEYGWLARPQPPSYSIENGVVSYAIGGVQVSLTMEQLMQSPASKAILRLNEADIAAMVASNGDAALMIHPYSRGGSHIVGKATLRQLKSRGILNLGKPDEGLFIAPSGEVDRLLARTANPRIIEVALGIPQGSLGSEFVRIDVPDALQRNLRMPDPRFRIDDPYHLPGTGFTIGGLREGVIDPIPMPEVAP